MICLCSIPTTHCPHLQTCIVPIPTTSSIPENTTQSQGSNFLHLFTISTIPMQRQMQDLFDKLWGTPFPIIQEFMVQVPLANYGINPGYKIPMSSKGKRTFAPPKFESKRDIELFQMVEVESNLPCGVRRLLVGREYCKVYEMLIETEAERWKGVRMDDIIPDEPEHSCLDYEISGQPGAGMFLSLLVDSPVKSIVPYPVLQPKSVYSLTEITIK